MTRLRKALVDGGYGGSPLADLGRGFRLAPRRWLVERAFARLVKRRRLRVDHEERARSSVAWVQAAMVRLMARDLAKAA